MLDRYNTAAVRLLATCADKTSRFDELKSNWFKLTPHAYYPYLLVKECIAQHKALDYVTLTHIVQASQSIYEKAIAEFGNKEILKTKLEDELEKIICEVLKSQPDTMQMHYEVVRKTFIQDYISIRAIRSLEKAQHDINEGKDPGYVMSGLYNPSQEINLSEPTGFTDRVISMLDEHYEPPFLTGIEQVDSKGGLEKGKMLTLGGDSGNQKTRFSIWLCLCILIKNPDFKCIYFEKETKAADIIYILLSFITRQSVTTIKKAGADYLKQYVGILKDADLAILDRFHVVDYTQFTSIEDMAHYVSSFEPDIWVLDFVGMYAQGESTDKATMAASNTVSKLKDLVHKSNTLGIVLSQFRKDSTAKRICKIPERNDLEWSAKLYQYSEWVWLNFSPFYYHNEELEHSSVKNYFYVIYTKWRNEPNGKFCFNSYPETARYTEPDTVTREAMVRWYDAYKKGN